MSRIAREIQFETSNQIPDATSVLGESQKALIDLFGRYDRSRSIVEKAAITQEICTALRTEIQIEEDIFYPAVKKVLKETGTISAAIMANSILKYLIAEIEDLDADSSVYDIKVRVLSEHVKENIIEKQTKLFPKVNASGSLDVWGLGAQLKARKEKLMDTAVC